MQSGEREAEMVWGGARYGCSSCIMQWCMLLLAPATLLLPPPALCLHPYPFCTVPASTSTSIASTTPTCHPGGGHRCGSTLCCMGSMRGACSGACGRGKAGEGSGRAVLRS